METMPFFLLLALGMGLVLLLDPISGFLRPTYISEPILALTLGAIAGPAVGFGILDLRRLGDPKVLLEHAAQVTIAIGLTGVALRTPPRFPLRFTRTLAVLLRNGQRYC